MLDKIMYHASRIGIGISITSIVMMICVGVSLGVNILGQYAWGQIVMAAIMVATILYFIYQFGYK